MELREFFNRELVNLDLASDNKDDILKELIGLLGLDEKSQGILFKMLKRRENLGSPASAAASPSRTAAPSSSTACASLSAASLRAWTSRQSTASPCTSSS